MGLKGSQVEIVITELKYGGKAVGAYEDLPVITNFGIPGQRQLVKIKRMRQSYIEATTIEIVEQSPLMTDNPCPHWEDCGGCSLQGMPYQQQIELKTNQIKSLFQRNDLEPGNWLPALTSPKIDEYRNKMEFSFGNTYKNGPLTLGMHQRGRRHDVVDTPFCRLVDEDIRKIRSITARFFRDRGILPYHRMTHQGILRHLVVRKAATTGEILINLVTTHQPDLPVEEWKNQLLALSLEGSIEGILWTHNDCVADIVNSDSTQCLFGQASISEQLMNLRFTITPFSFFQTNSHAAALLFNSINEWLTSEDRCVIDLYCGLGTISQMVAKKARHVTGVELVEESVNQARVDSVYNGVKNVDYIAGDVREILHQLPHQPDLLIVDPPRAGIHPKVMDQLLTMGVERFIYVSCNPVSMIENLKQAANCGWHIVKARPIDMFPYTPHVETVVLMSRVEK